MQRKQQHHTYKRRSRSAQEGQEVTTVHEFEDEKLRLVVETDPEQAKDVVVLKVVHQKRFLQKLLLLNIAGTFVQRLERSRQVQSADNVKLMRY